jgi:dihydropteroate synthase
MGIVNLTPDSFFPDSRSPEPARAVERALALQEEGAEILDFGAESTRPGSAPVDPKEEIRRLIPTLKAFRARSGAVVSVDTRKAEVARAALDEGADIVNDIAALSDPGMAALVARTGAGLVLMHMLGEPSTMQECLFTTIAPPRSRNIFAPSPPEPWPRGFRKILSSWTGNRFWENART